MTPPPPKKKKKKKWQEERKKKRGINWGGGGGGEKMEAKEKGGGGRPPPPTMWEEERERKKRGRIFFMRVETKERKKEQKKKKKNRGEGKGCCHQRSPNNSHVLSTVHLCTQWKVTLHIAGHCHLAPTVHSDDSLMHVVKPLAQSSETAGAVTVCLPNNIQCMSSLGLRGCTEHWRWCCPDCEARGWCAHSQGSARHPWADHRGGVASLHSHIQCRWMRVLAQTGKQGMVRTLAGECTASLSWPWDVCGEPAVPFNSTDSVLAPIGKRWGGAHTRRGVHGIPVLSMGCVVIEPAQLTFNINEWGCCPDWEAGLVCTLMVGVHTHVHGILSWPWGVYGEPAQLI